MKTKNLLRTRVKITPTVPFFFIAKTSELLFICNLGARYRCRCRGRGGGGR